MPRNRITTDYSWLAYRPELSVLFYCYRVPFSPPLFYRRSITAFYTRYIHHPLARKRPLGEPLSRPGCWDAEMDKIGQRFAEWIQKRTRHVLTTRSVNPSVRGSLEKKSGRGLDKAVMCPVVEEKESCTCMHACKHIPTVLPVYARYGAALLGRLTEWLKYGYYRGN